MQESNLPLSKSLNFLLCNLNALTPGMAFFSPNDKHANGCVIIFVRQGYIFFDLSTPSLSSLDTYSDHIWVNISPNSFSSLSFLMFMLPLLSLFFRIAEPIPCFLPLFPPPEISLFWGEFNYNHLLWDSKGTSDDRGEEVFNWVICSDLLPLKETHTPTLLHHFSGSRFFPDIFFAPSSLVLSLLPGR